MTEQKIAPIPRDLLGKIVEVFDGACEDTNAVEDIYRIVMSEQAVLARVGAARDQSTILSSTLEEIHKWMDSQADAQSKGGHATFDLMMLRELRDKASEALKGTPAAAPANEHIDDDAVDAFAVAMKNKLADARRKGRSRWFECDPADLSRMLREHVEKGDPRDVANFCMFLWSLGRPITPAASVAVAYWAAVNKDGEIEYSCNADDANGGEFARDMCNQHINGRLNDGGGSLRLKPLYAAAQPPSSAGPLTAVEASDMERLDWLAAEGCYVESLTLGNGPKYRVNWTLPEEWQGEWYVTPRAAIDAAIAASNGKAS